MDASTVQMNDLSNVEQLQLLATTSIYDATTGKFEANTTRWWDH